MKSKIKNGIMIFLKYILKLTKNDNWQMSKIYLESIPEIEQQINNEKY